MYEGFYSTELHVKFRFAIEGIYEIGKLSNNMKEFSNYVVWFQLLLRLACQRMSAAYFYQHKATGNNLTRLLRNWHKVIIERHLG